MTTMRSIRELDRLDQELLNELQDRFPTAPRPYAELGSRLGISESEVIERVGALHEFGVVRQLSPIFDTKALGYQSSLVAMRVAPEKLRHAAHVVNGHPGVSHNYKRDHEFNLWFTVAVPPQADLQEHVDALHRHSGAESARLLPTLRLFKIGVTLDMTGQRPIDHRSTPQYTHEMRETAAKNSLTEHDVAVIRAVQNDLPLVPEPFAGPAAELGCSVPDLMEALASLHQRGYLRRFAAILRHRLAGFGANGMAVWKVPESQVLDMGQTMAGYTVISHCYQRPTYDDWPYNLFTMIHARRKSECAAFVRDLSQRHDLPDHAVLYSTYEYKKVRVRYFTDEYDEWEKRYVRGQNGS